MPAAAKGTPKDGGQTKRVELIKKIEKLRDSKVICFLTSLRPGVRAQMADDSIRQMFDHLLQLPERPVPKLDIFLVSNGGVTTVPWRLISLFREFAKRVAVIVPYRAYSAATMLALGADEIVMHSFGELGPIDPTVSNDFNPVDPVNNRKLGISVEDVKAYVTFIKSTVGITHEDELIKAVEVLAEKVHPLALGNVERFISQSRMMGRKIMRTHMLDSEEHIISETIENLASKLYFHGHPINRKEAADELKLKVVRAVDRKLEDAIWSLYLMYEDEFKNVQEFNPTIEIARLKAAAVPAATAVGPLPAQAQPASQQAPSQPSAASPQLMSFDEALLLAQIECSNSTSSYVSRRRWSEVLVPGQPFPQIREETQSQGWIRT